MKLIEFFLINSDNFLDANIKMSNLPLKNRENLVKFLILGNIKLQNTPGNYIELDKISDFGEKF